MTPVGGCRCGQKRVANIQPTKTNAVHELMAPKSAVKVVAGQCVQFSRWTCERPVSVRTWITRARGVINKGWRSDKRQLSSTSSAVSLCRSSKRSPANAELLTLLLPIRICGREKVHDFVGGLHSSRLAGAALNGPIQKSLLTILRKSEGAG